MEKISFLDNKILVPDHPTIPYIIGDGIGVDITPVMIAVVDASVLKIYKGTRKITWEKVIAGEEAEKESGLLSKEIEALSAKEKQDVYLPKKTVETIADSTIAIKGPLTTPVGGGFRSLNVTIRQLLNLYACVRPVKWYEGVPAPIREPEKLDVVIFRENTEDVYAGIEWSVESEKARLARDFLNKIGHQVREDSAIGIKPISVSASKRLIRAALDYAIAEKRRNVTLVHKGNIMKYTEGAFKNWGYEVALQEYRDKIVTETEYTALKIKAEYSDRSVFDLSDMLKEKGVKLSAQELGTMINTLGHTHGGFNLRDKIVIKDRIADQMFQQLLLRPDDYDVIATMNLNGDYLSDACAAEVGGLGIAPGANINFETGTAVFEATHGSAPRHAGLNKANPSSMILSAVMMLRYMGWDEAANLCEMAIAKTIQQGTVTYDLERMMTKAELVSTSGFGEMIIENMRIR